MRPVMLTRRRRRRKPPRLGSTRARLCQRPFAKAKWHTLAVALPLAAPCGEPRPRAWRHRGRSSLRSRRAAPAAPCSRRRGSPMLHCGRRRDCRGDPRAARRRAACRRAGRTKNVRGWTASGRRRSPACLGASALPPLLRPTGVARRAAAVARTCAATTSSRDAGLKAERRGARARPAQPGSGLSMARHGPAARSSRTLSHYLRPVFRSSTWTNEPFSGEL